jgi:hypothetical protein
LIARLGFVVRDLGFGLGVPTDDFVVVIAGTDISGADVVIGVISWASVIGVSSLAGASTETTGE